MYSRYNFIRSIPLIIGCSKGHLCLWREDSLKEKYNTKYFKITFYLIFRVYK